MTAPAAPASKVRRRMVIWLSLLLAGFVAIQLWARLSSVPADVGPGPALRGVQASNGAEDRYEFASAAERDAARDHLAAVIAARPRTRILREEAGYLHAVVRSRVFGFPDDIELLVDPDSPTIHIQSQARLGHSDFGANARHLAAIRTEFAAKSQD